LVRVRSGAAPFAVFKGCGFKWKCIVEYRKLEPRESPPLQNQQGWCTRPPIKVKAIEIKRD
jgi:hypothetical protein